MDATKSIERHTIYKLRCETAKREKVREKMLGKLLRVMQIIWTTAIRLAGAAVGAAYGWESYGVIGGTALSFCGLIIGRLLSSPLLLCCF